RRTTAARSATRVTSRRAGRIDVIIERAPGAAPTVAEARRAARARRRRREERSAARSLVARVRGDSCARRAHRPLNAFTVVFPLMRFYSIDYFDKRLMKRSTPSASAPASFQATARASSPSAREGLLDEQEIEEIERAWPNGLTSRQIVDVFET